MEQHYLTLGVPRTASLDEIRRQYWGLAKKFHPDCNPGDPAAAEHFKRISNAYARVRGERDSRTPAPAASNHDAERGQRSGFDPVTMLYRWTMWQMTLWSWSAVQPVR